MLPISIVIPTYNRSKLLAYMLPSYLAQECAEIVIVDDASTPPVEDVICGQIPKDHASRVVIVRNSVRLQQPHSRMIGVSTASQSLVFFGEDDAYLERGHIHALYIQHSIGSADIVGGPWITTESLDYSADLLPLPLSVEDVIDMQNLRIFTGQLPKEPICVPFLHTLTLIPKRIIQDLTFDMSYKGNAFREETDFYLSAAKQGYRLAYVPSPSAYHYKGALNVGGGQHQVGLLSSLLWYEFWVAKNNIYFLAKHRNFLNEIGRNTHPILDTAQMMLSRVRGYPGRLRKQWQLRRS